MSKVELHQVAWATAFSKLGLLVPPAATPDGRSTSPQRELKSLPAAESRKMRRKYRKLWRKALARELQGFERLPKRRQKKVAESVFIGGRWRHVTGFEVPFQRLKELQIGERPSFYGRACRWFMVKGGKEVAKELRKAKLGLGLVRPKGPRPE